ncbi:MAG: DUF3102 domain-containing protein [Clostridia bacterium]|nr:DUF3102 domain-containing protein [Clostridia bacterium]
MEALRIIEQETGLMTLADYEARIYVYKAQINTGFIGIGRTLNEAKEAKVVPHGQWETWVTTVTGMGLQYAQRCMRAAKEIKDGSALARLDMTKALMLLSSGLNEDTQEELAEKAAEESTTVKELRAEIERQKADLAVFERAAMAAEEKAGRANDRAVRLADREKEARKDAKAAQVHADACQEITVQLREELEALQAEAGKGISTEAQAIIDGLRADLQAAEKREERRAKQLETLRREHTQRAMDDARSLSTSSLSGFDLAATVRAFIGSAGVLPQMGRTLRTLPLKERETIRQNIDTVAEWVHGARMALGYIEGEYEVREG